MEDSKQHVQLPNNMTRSGNLSPKDLLVYVTIKGHMNAKTKECYPSLDTIAKESGISKPTVRKAIEALKEEGYIIVSSRGRSNQYTFSPYKTFEPFSIEFLKNKEIDANLKAYILTSQQVMFKDLEGYGKISYSDSELADIINLDRHTIAKYNKTLEDKGFLSIIKTDARNQITGVQINEKIFHLDELGQTIIWALQKHEEDINKLKEISEANTKDMKIILKEFNEMKKEIKFLKYGKEEEDGTMRI
jgi:biotin operon repressor